MNKGGIDDVSAFLKDFMKRQEIEGLHLLWQDLSKEEIQQLIKMACTDFPKVRFLRIVTDESERVEG